MTTQKRLKELLHYDTKTGIFRWRVSRGGIRRGDQAGCLYPNGYRYIRIDRKNYRASRLAWMYVEGYMPENEVDHINRAKDDDRWVNLRHVGRQCNARNCGNRCDNTSLVKGVHWHRRVKKWQVYIMVNYKNHYLGRYDDFDNAVCARLAAEQCLNWSGCDSSSPAFRYVKNNFKWNEKTIDT